MQIVKLKQNEYSWEESLPSLWLCCCLKPWGITELVVTCYLVAEGNGTSLSNRFKSFNAALAQSWRLSEGKAFINRISWNAPFHPRRSWHSSNPPFKASAWFQSAGKVISHHMLRTWFIQICPNEGRSGKCSCQHCHQISALSGPRCSLKHLCLGGFLASKSLTEKKGKCWVLLGLGQLLPHYTDCMGSSHVLMWYY